MPLDNPFTIDFTNDFGPGEVASMALPDITPTGAVGLLATNSSSRVTIPSAGTPTQIVIFNFGPSAAFVALGDNTVVATVAGGFAVMPFGTAVLHLGTNTNLAAITTHDTAALHINAGT